MLAEIGAANCLELHLELAATSAEAITSLQCRLRCDTPPLDISWESTPPMDADSLAVHFSQMRRIAKARSKVPELYGKIVQTGSQLFDWLFAGDRYDRFDQVIRHALCLYIHIPRGLLSQVPWELLYDTRCESDLPFIATRTDIFVVRVPYREGQPAVESKALEDRPLRLLIASACPLDIAHTNPTKEARTICKQLRERTQQDDVRIFNKEELDWHSFLRQFLEIQPHVLHLILHGTRGGLIFEKGEVSHEKISNAGISQALRVNPALALVILSACHSASAATTEKVASLAHKLTEDGIAATVAMQAEISAPAAKEFSAIFYQALATGKSVAFAVSWARNAMAARLDSAISMQWSIPVLYQNANVIPFPTVVRDLHKVTAGASLSVAELRELREEISSAYKCLEQHYGLLLLGPEPLSEDFMSATLRLKSLDYVWERLRSMEAGYDHQWVDWLFRARDMVRDTNRLFSRYIDLVNGLTFASPNDPRYSAISTKAVRVGERGIEIGQRLCDHFNKLPS